MIENFSHRGMAARRTMTQQECIMENGAHIDDDPERRMHGKDQTEPPRNLTILMPIRPGVRPPIRPVQAPMPITIHIRICTTIHLLSSMFKINQPSRGEAKHFTENAKKWRVSREQLGLCK